MSRAESLKYPRTFHLSCSPGLQNDDRRHPDESVFQDQRIIITEKIDGEGTTMTAERTYPRSPDARYHPSRDLMKANHAARAHRIPEGWRVSGEYAYALHSVAYTKANGNALRDWFLGFAIWDERNVALCWDETLEHFQALDITPVPILYDGVYDRKIIEQIAATLDTDRQEGFVMRLADELAYPTGTPPYGQFFQGVAKWVRRGHVQTDQHWMHGPVIPNEIDS